MSFQLSGLVGGLVATVVMTALMMALGDDSPPPTAAFYAKFVGDGSPDEYMMQGMVLHLLYGTGAGWVFGLMAGAGILAFGIQSVTGGLINGLVYGLILMVGAVVWLRGIIGQEPEPAEVGMMTGFHLVYGLVLGAFVGAGLLV